MAVRPDKGCTVCGFCIYSLTLRKVVILACDEATMPPPRKPPLSLVEAVQELLHSTPSRRTTGDRLSGEAASGLLPSLLVEAENSRGGNC